MISEPMYPSLITNLLQPNPKAWSKSEFGLLLPSVKNKERNRSGQPFSASLGRVISGKFIYSCRTRALGKAKQEEMG